MSDVRQAGARIEELLAVLSSDPNTAPAAEELVRVLLSLYGRGLGGIMTILDETGEAGATVRDKIVADPLIEGLLLLHDLHPLDTDTRIQQALDRVRPYLGSHAGGVQYLGVSSDGVAHLRLEGSCQGCPSSTVTVQLAIQGAVEDAAPEVTEVLVEGVAAPPAQPLLQIGSRPPGAGGGAAGPPGAASSPGAGHGADPGWVTLPNFGPPSGKPLATVAAGVPVLICSVRGTLYAYRDACPGCGSSLGGAALTMERLECAGCGAAFDVRRAGTSIGGDGSHLDPLPLLADSQGVRVAVPAAAEAAAP